jgi:tetratricopeptide (TPR) repeat protein
MKALLRGVIALLFMAVCQPALAGEWRKAQTQHFNVYGEVKESELRTAASDLERYHRLLAAMMKVDDKAAVARLDIYLVSKREDLGQVEPDLDRAVAGFYRARPGGRAAFVSWSSHDRDQARRILQHEYAHHFMRQYFTWSYPVWFTEGFAEYFATTVVVGDTIQLGGATDGQTYLLESRPWMSMDTLLNARSSITRDGMVYPQGWLLTHYLLRDGDRAAQLQAYFAAMRAGKPEAEAFTDAFKTDKGALQRQLTGYAKIGMTVTVIPIKPLAPTEVVITALPPSADDLLLDSLGLMRGRRGETDAQAADALKAIEKKAAKYPGDPLAARTLAHAQQVYGDPAVAVDMFKTLATIQDDPYGQYLLGVSWLAVGKRDPARQAQAANEGNKALARALKLDPTFYPALYRYSRTLRPGSDGELDALVQAHLMAPQVDDIRITAVIALLRKGEYEPAAILIDPLAQSPHVNLNVAVAQVLRDKAAARQAPASDQALTAEARTRLQALEAQAKS